MTKRYPVHLGEKRIGNACVTRQGLYYKIDCLCSFPKQDLYRIELTCGEAAQSLGVCVPKQSGFGLQTSIPVRRIGEGDFRFRALPGREEANDTFVPIDPEAPFFHLQQLKNACLEIRDGTMGVRFKSTAPDPPDSDQSP